ncbi:hypothetical protein G6L37_11865 [Agrobacterium rubi]|uniref:hypothetical protein n=1 Tax=Agrobacterium rubi TaxID=28099 RepID=UPI001573E459|nr:hypothetical protein [Agrobacterium rubi]NTF06858.1 hypothetical protein [Agrobacterium rubi]NTF19100.1 hypothetical protein [Agrobacterium rubi]NTF26063.1 hypothetical protein [Agrobacterium rubi]
MAVNNRWLSLLDRTEGGGSYSTLFGNRQKRKDSPFNGVDVSQMSVGEVMDFTSPNGAYGQSVKNEIGRVATPTGRYQIVGTTLRGAVNELGIDPSRPYDKNTQDQIAQHLIQRRLASADTLEGKRAAVRAEWEGFKHVSDAELDAAINDSGYVDPAVTTRPRSEPTQAGTQMAAATPTPDPNVDRRMLDDKGKELTGIPAAFRDFRNGVDDTIGVETADDGTRKLWGFELDGENGLGAGIAGFGKAFADAETKQQAPPMIQPQGRTGGNTPVQIQFADSILNTKDEDERKRRLGGLAGFGGFTRRA